MSEADLQQEIQELEARVSRLEGQNAQKTKKPTQKPDVPALTAGASPVQDGERQ